MNTTKKNPIYQIGTKFYKYEDDNLILIKITLNKDNINYLTIDNNNEYKTYTGEELKNDFTMLSIDGYITFSVVKIFGFKDIIVSFHTKDDMMLPPHTPYAICRQFIDDAFANPLLENSKYTCVGISITQDTCPANINFNEITACDGVNYQQTVAIYTDDKLSDILKLIKTKNYDEVIEDIYKNTTNRDTVLGLSRNLEGLLRDNYFMHDVYMGFNIIQVPFTLNDKVSGSINNDSELLIYLNKITNTIYNNAVIMRYTKETDLNAIKRNHIIIADNKENLYIIIFDKIEGYVQSINVQQSKDHLNKMKFISNGFELKI